MTNQLPIGRTSSPAYNAIVSSNHYTFITVVMYQMVTDIARVIICQNISIKE